MKYVILLLTSLSVFSSCEIQEHHYCDHEHIDSYYYEGYDNESCIIEYEYYTNETCEIITCYEPDGWIYEEEECWYD